MGRKNPEGDGGQDGAMHSDRSGSSSEVDVDEEEGRVSREIIREHGSSEEGSEWTGSACSDEREEGEGAGTFEGDNDPGTTFASPNL